MAEPFTSWVLEDDFSDGRPPLEDVDCLLVDDVTPYEQMKLRLLNASHQSLCYFAYLAGYRLVHDAAGDPLFADFLMRYMDTEATPTLLPVPGIDLPDYKRTLIERFANPGVRDTIVRLCFGSSDRIPKWLLPVIRANLAADRPDPAVSGDGGQLGALRRGRRRAGRADRGPGPARRDARSAGPLATRQSDRVHRKHRGVRGSRRPMTGSWRPTYGPWTHCTAMARGRRWRALMRKEYVMTTSETEQRALVIGEALIDIVERDGQVIGEHVGGSPLNVAVGLARLGRGVDFLTHIGDDARGRRIADYVEASGAELVSGSVDARDRTPTALATLDESGVGALRLRHRLAVDGYPRRSRPPLVAHTGSIAAVLEPGCRATAALLDAYHLVGHHHIRPECASGADQRR